MLEVAPLASKDPLDTVACLELIQALPDEVDPGVERRVVRTDPTRFAAYGDPPILLRCGVPEPERVAEPVTINDVDWSVRDSGAGFTWTTTGRTAALEVEIPDSYENFAELIVPLTGPVAAHLPKAPPG